MVRYRDNYLLLLLRAQGDSYPLEAKLHDAMSTLSSVIGMKLKIENLGPVIPFLEATLQLNPTGMPDLRLRMPVFLYEVGMSTVPCPVRMIDAHYPSAKGMLRSCVPSIVLKCQSMGFSHVAFSENVYHKNYPGEWWKPQLVYISDKCGLGAHARQGVQQAEREHQSTAVTQR